MTELDQLVTAFELVLAHNASEITGAREVAVELANTALVVLGLEEPVVEATNVEAFVSIDGARIEVRQVEPEGSPATTRP